MAIFLSPRVSMKELRKIFMQPQIPFSSKQTISCTRIRGMVTSIPLSTDWFMSLLPETTVLTIIFRRGIFSFMRISVNATGSSCTSGCSGVLRVEDQLMMCTMYRSGRPKSLLAGWYVIVSSELSGAFVSMSREGNTSLNKRSNAVR